MNANMSLKKDDDKDTSIIIHGDNKNERIANMHTEVIHELTYSKIRPSFNKEGKIIAIDPIDYVNYEEKVSKNDKINTIYEGTSMNKVNDFIHEQKNENISLKHCDNTFEACINTICLDSPKKDSDINHDLSKNSVITEFDEVLSELKKADDSTHNFRQENFSLSFVDEFFGELNGDINKYDLIHRQNNFKKNPDSKLTLKTDEPILTNTSQTSLKKVKMNNKPYKDYCVNIEVPREITNKTELESIINEYIYNIAPKKTDAMMLKSENRMSVTNNKTLIKEDIECIESARRKESAGLYSFKELTKVQVNSSKTPVKTIVNDLSEVESTIEKYVKLNKSDHNLENTKNLQIVCDEDNSTNLYKQCAEAKLDIISISSTEDDVIDVDKLNDSYCSGYHSSDFEFITESEAELNGIVANFVSKESYEFKNDRATQECGSSVSAATVENYNEPPNPSPVNNNEIITTRNEIPQGDEYLNLFRGIHDPVLPLAHIYFLENKSVRVTSMNVQFEGIGFDVRMMHRPESEDTDDECE